MSEQHEPALDGALEATDEQRIDGIVAQVAADIAQHEDPDVEALLRQRLADSGIELGDAEIRGLAARVA
jgi:predicted negative regulator of RcsB-dependent stress response